MPQPDWEKVKAYVFDRLSRELPPGLYYHGIHHTQDDVLPAAERLADLAKLDAPERLLLCTAALYHEVGLIETYGAGHEMAGAHIAAQSLPDYGYTPAQIQAIQELIMATSLSYQPQNLLEKLIRDADLDSLGREDYFQTNKNLLLELQEHGANLSLKQWYEIQLKFLSTHTYHTEIAADLRDPGKRKNIKKLKQRLRHLSKAGSAND